MNRGRWFDRIRLGALAVAVYALAHNLTFLATYGVAYAAALERTGHGGRWDATVTVVVVLAVALTGAALARLLQLRLLTRRLHAGAIHVEHARLADLARHLAGSWPPILGGALVLFVCGENLERLTAGLPAPGLSVLGSNQYEIAFLIFAATSFVAAVIDALYRWRRDVLVARIAAARTGALRSQPGGLGPATPWIDRPQSALVWHRIAGRAPPLVATDR